MNRDQQLRTLTVNVFEKAAAAVQRGPFTGMTLVQETSWHGGKVLQKLLGIYEMELHAAIEEAVAFHPTSIVNVGCAEGYYAVGLALRLPQATVHVFDSDLAALSVCEKAAAANRAESNLRLEKSCTGTQITTLLRRAERCLMFVDCEGCETTLFPEIDLKDLIRTIVIVEMHEYLFPGSTEELMQRFENTHQVQSIAQSARNPHEIEFLRDLPEDTQWLAVSEGRPQTMNWFFAVPRTTDRATA